MDRRVRIRVLALGMAFLWVTPALGESEPLTWLIADQPPQFIISGPEKGRGTIDGVMAYLQERLPEFSHQVNVNNIQRTMTELQTNGHFAAMGLVKTPEREKLVLFSEPFSASLPPGLLVRRTTLPDLKPYLASDGSLDLEPFLRVGRFSVGVAAGRSYGPETDALLTQYKDRGVVYTRFADTGIMAGLVDMLSADRVDAVFVYRSEVRYVIRDEAHLGSLIVLPVHPAAKPLTIHVAVPRTEWGRIFLEKLNPILLKARLDPEFRRMADRWSDDETRIQVLRVLQELK